MDTFIIFCEFNESFPEGKYFFNFNDTFNYSDYRVNLLSNNTFNITKVDSNMIDIYSHPQTINVTDNKDTYDLKFNLLSYNQESIFIRLIYDESLDCKKNNQQLICQVKKDLLESCNSNSTTIIQWPILSFNDNGKQNFLLLVSSITINFSVQKKDIYVKITKLLSDDTIEIKNSFIYETNETNIPMINTFDNQFQLEFNGSEKNLSCFFRKGRVGPLLIFCNAINEGIFSLKEIKSDIILRDINIKYNFIIKPVHINKNITVINETAKHLIEAIFPMVLDFTKNDYVYINLFLGEEWFFTGVTFNEDAEDLQCEKLGVIQRCKVPKNHFKGKKETYYYLLCFNTMLNKRVASFYTGAVSVLMDNSNPKEGDGNYTTLIIIIISILVFLIILCIVFLIARKRRKNNEEESVQRVDEQNLLESN